MQLPHIPHAGRVLVSAVVVVLAVVLAAASLRTPTPPGAVEGPTGAGRHLQVLSGGALTAPMVAAAVKSIGWSAESVVLDDAGISRGPAGTKPLAVAVRGGDVGTGDDMILVQGGEGDVKATQRELEVGIYHLLDWLIAYAPKDSIIVLAGPIPAPGLPTADLLRVNHAMRFAARQRQVRYLDAFELKWAADEDLSAQLAGQLVAAAKPRDFAPPLPEASPTPSASPGSSPTETPIPTATP